MRHAPQQNKRYISFNSSETRKLEKAGVRPEIDFDERGKRWEHEIAFLLFL